MLKKMFVSVMEFDYGNELMTTYVVNTGEGLFPEGAFRIAYPLLEKFSNVVESILGLEMFFSVTCLDGEGPVLADKCDAIVLSTLQLPDGQEVLWHVLTPLGTLYLQFFENKWKKWMEINSVELTTELVKALYAVPCDIEYDYSSDRALIRPFGALETEYEDYQELLGYEGLEELMGCPPYEYASVSGIYTDYETGEEDYFEQRFPVLHYQLNGWSPQNHP